MAKIAATMDWVAIIESTDKRPVYRKKATQSRRTTSPHQFSFAYNLLLDVARTNGIVVLALHWLFGYSDASEAIRFDSRVVWIFGDCVI